MIRRRVRMTVSFSISNSVAMDWTSVPRSVVTSERISMR